MIALCTRIQTRWGRRARGEKKDKKLLGLNDPRGSSILIIIFDSEFF